MSLSVSRKYLPGTRNSQSLARPALLNLGFPPPPLTNSLFAPYLPPIRHAKVAAIKGKGHSASLTGLPVFARVGKVTDANGTYLVKGGIPRQSLSLELALPPHHENAPQLSTIRDRRQLVGTPVKNKNWLRMCWPE